MANPWGNYGDSCLVCLAFGGSSLNVVMNTKNKRYSRAFFCPCHLYFVNLHAQ